MQTPTTETVDLRSLGYLERHVRPLDDELFEISPTIDGDWEMWSRAGFTGNDMYAEMSNKRVISGAVGMPTLMHYFTNQNDIPDSWMMNRIFGLRGAVIHLDGDYVVPYLDCSHVDSDDVVLAQIYIGFFRLKGKLTKDDAFIFLR